eukprot:1599360-Prorocentrum_lima.AAC.1
MSASKAALTPAELSGPDRRRLRWDSWRASPSLSAPGPPTPEGPVWPVRPVSLPEGREPKA